MRWWANVGKSAAEITAVERSVCYAGCGQAHAAGLAPIYRGSPGYCEGMDGDGVTGEPNRWSIKPPMFADIRCQLLINEGTFGY